MNFALLGADLESLALCGSLVSGGHRILWAGDLAGTERYTFPWLPPEDSGQAWETLLDANFCDAVLVGRGAIPGQDRLNQLTQLVKQGIPVLATFPLGDSLLSYYEIEMAHSEGKGLLLHYNPLVAFAAEISTWNDWVRTGHPEIGTIEQLVWERSLVSRQRESVIWHFTRDVELLDRVAGPLTRLGAVGSPLEDATYSGLNVQLQGESKIPVRWTVGPLEDQPGARLSFIGERGREHVQFDERGCLVSAVVQYGETRRTTPLSGESPIDFACAQLLQSLTAPPAVRSSWPTALRAMELADTIEISLRRGRTIEVHRQQLTEELSFRGTMSAVGCGLLLLLPPLLMIAGWFSEQLGLPIAKYWAHVLLALLAVFLFFQVGAKFLIGSAADKSPTNHDSNRRESS